MIKLSVLDQSPIRSGGSHADAIAETLKLAQTVDRLGYSRYWVAEHHNSLGLACTVPEILISRIASMTNRLRVGAGRIIGIDSQDLLGQIWDDRFSFGRFKPPWL